MTKPNDDVRNTEVCPSCIGSPAIYDVPVPMPATCGCHALSMNVLEICLLVLLSLWVGSPVLPWKLLGEERSMPTMTARAVVAGPPSSCNKTHKVQKATGRYLARCPNTRSSTQLLLRTFLTKPAAIASEAWMASSCAWVSSKRPSSSAVRTATPKDSYTSSPVIS